MLVGWTSVVSGWPSVVMVVTWVGVRLFDWEIDGE